MTCEQGLLRLLWGGGPEVGVLRHCSDGQFIKQAWLECAPVLFENFNEKEKIIQRIKEIPLSRSTVKIRILNLADNISHQRVQT